MMDPAQIFRPEALRSRAVPPAQPFPGDPLRASPRWITAAYWVLLALLAAGLIASALIRVGSQSLIVALVGGLVSGTGHG